MSDIEPAGTSLPGKRTVPTRRPATAIEQALAGAGDRAGCATEDHRVCDTHYAMWLPDYGCCYFVMLPLAAIGAALEAPTDD